MNDNFFVIPFAMQLISKKLMILQVTELINSHGADKLALKQVIIKSDAMPCEMVATFSNVNQLIISCISEALFSLSIFCTENYAPHSKAGFFPIWYLLIEFNYLHSLEGGLISRVLRSPSNFPACDIKSDLIKIFNEKLRSSFTELTLCNEEIRFLIFVYMFQTANKFSLQLSTGSSFQERQNTAWQEFNKHTSGTINSLTKLPIV